MTEQTKDTGARPQTAPAVEDKSFLDVMRALIGKTVTIVNPESYEAAPIGFRLAEGFYRGKLTGLGSDYLVLMTEFERKKGAKEPVRQFVPLGRVKRLSLMKQEAVIHL